MTALSGSEKATVSVGYLSQFFGMPVILPSMLWKGVGAGSPTRSHLGHVDRAREMSDHALEEEPVEPLSSGIRKLLHLGRCVEPAVADVLQRLI